MGGGSKLIKATAGKQIQRATKKVTKNAAKQSRKVSSVTKPKRVKAHVQRAIKDKEPKLVENTKNLLVMRGNKTNEEVNTLLRDLVRLQAGRLFWLYMQSELTVAFGIVCRRPLAHDQGAGRQDDGQEERHPRL